MSPSNDAAHGHRVRWWSWVISGFIVLNGTISLVPALRRRLWLQLTVSFVGFVAGLVVILAIVQAW
jgi:hypothetical protein